MSNLLRHLVSLRRETGNLFISSPRYFQHRIGQHPKHNDHHQSSIPQAEAAICHCNFMLIEKRESLTIPCSFSPQLLFHTISLSSLTFIFFCFYNEKSTFSPRPKQFLFPTFSYMFCCTFFFMLCSNRLLWTLCRCVGPFVSPCHYKICPCKKRDAQEARGGTQQPAGSGVACSVVCAMRHRCFSEVVKCQNTLRGEAFVSSASPNWENSSLCCGEVWKVWVICHELTTGPRFSLVSCWDRHGQAENNRFSEPPCQWGRNALHYP